MAGTSCRELIHSCCCCSSISTTTPTAAAAAAPCPNRSLGATAAAADCRQLPTLMACMCWALHTVQARRSTIFLVVFACGSQGAPPGQQQHAC